MLISKMYCKSHCRKLQNCQFRVFSSVGKFNTSKDYYKILQIQKSSNSQDIKKSFYKLAKKYHPDRDPTMQSKFKEINQAYGVLSDSTIKVQYDMAMRYQNQTFSNSQKYGNRNNYNSQSQYHSQYQSQQQSKYQGYDQDQRYTRGYGQDYQSRQYEDQNNRYGYQAKPQYEDPYNYGYNNNNQSNNEQSQRNNNNKQKYYKSEEFIDSQLNSITKLFRYSIIFSMLGFTLLYIFRGRRTNPEFCNYNQQQGNDRYEYYPNMVIREDQDPRIRRSRINQQYQFLNIPRIPEPPTYPRANNRNIPGTYFP